MESIKELLGCHCHGFRQSSWKNLGADRSHTFSWAKTHYGVERPVLPRHQFLNLSLDIEKETLTGSNSIKVECVQKAVSKITLDSVDLDIEKIQFDGKNADFTLGEESLTVNLPKEMSRGQMGQLEVFYQCRSPKAGLYFIKPDKEYPNRATQVWTQGQDDDARFWFPGFDAPGIKCSFEMKIEVPKDFIATSNGALISKDQGASATVFHWKSDWLIPNYLVTLTAGKFSEIKEEWKGKTVNYLFEKGLEKEAQISFGKTTKMLDLFSKAIGVDYPYEKYSQVAVSEFVFGGMENTSSTTQTDVTLHPEEVESNFTSDDLVSHELAHQWFGDLVTCKSWAHGWLNEGWATYMEYFFKEHDLNLDEANYFRFQDFQFYLDEDGTYRRPVVSNFYSDPGEIWDRHIYQKGGLIIHMLRRLLGDDDFWAATGNYLKEFQGKTVETIDFQRHMEAASGKNLGRFFDQWVFKGGYPELEASFSWDEESKLASLTFEQKQKVDNLTPLFELNSEIEFVLPNGKTETFPVKIHEAKKTIAVKLSDKPTFCRFDKGGNLIKTLQWDLPQDMLIAQLEKDDDVIGRVWVARALAKKATAKGLEALSNALEKASFWGVRAEVAVSLGKTRSPLAKKALMGALSNEKHPKVRTKICEALGNFRDSTVAELLSQVIKADKNIFVKGAACVSLGKTKSPQAFDVLKDATKIESWNDIVAAKAYSGLRELKDERALPLFVAGAQYGAPKMARTSAISGLGDLGLDDKSITDQLENLLDDPFRSAMHAAASALINRKNPGSAAALEGAAHRVVDGHFKAAAFRAARDLRSSLDKPKEIAELQEQVSQMKTEAAELRQRLDKVEA